MKRKTAAALAALCLLSGCAQEAPPLPDAAPQSAVPAYQEVVTVEKTAMAQEAALEMMRQFALDHTVAFDFTAESFPRAAVSASAAPLLRAAARSLLNGDGGGTERDGMDGNGIGGDGTDDMTDGEAAAPAPLDCLSSADACRALLNGSALLALAEEPPASIWDEKDAAGYNWEMTPVAADALVFAVSADNPVSALSVQQIRGLYAGTITNWSEVGGPDLPVVPLRGGPGSDTETAMENLVMDGVPLLQDPALYGTLRDGAAPAGAIVCGGYYLSHGLTSGDSGWKLLAVDGAAPSPASIRSGLYPLLNRCYVLIPADSAADSPERALRDWLVSREGQELAVEAGYVPMMDLGGIS